MLSRSNFTSFVTFLQLLEVTIAVSSAKRTMFEFSHVSGKSFMYIKKKSGPKVEPCGTPQSMLLNEEFRLPEYDYTNCSPSEK